MTATRRKRLLSIGTLGTLLTLLVVLLDFAGQFAQLERALYDFRVRRCQFFLKPPTDQIVHVDIDDGALDQIGRWPWRRTVLAELVDEMNVAGAKLIVFDVLFAEASDESRAPRNGRGGPADPAADPDARLAEAFARGKNVVIAASLTFDRPTESDPLAPGAITELTRDLELGPGEVAARLAAKGVEVPDAVNRISATEATLRAQAMHQRIDNELDKAPNASADQLAERLLPRATADRGPRLAIERQFEKELEHVRAVRALRRFAVPPGPDLPPLIVARGGSLPIPRLAQAAAHGGFVDYVPERDGVVRRLPLAVWHEQAVLPQIGLVAACAAMGVDVRDLRITRDAVIVPRPPGLGGELVIPTRVQPDGPYAGTTTFIEIPLHGRPARAQPAWERMYDHPEYREPKARVGMVDVYAPCDTRETIAGNDATAVDFLSRVIAATDPEAAEALLKNPPAGEDLVGQVESAVDDLAFATDSVAKLENPSEHDKAQLELLRLAAAPARALNGWKAERPKLLARLDKQREQLAERLRGRVVFVGSVSTGASDFVASSLDARCPGVYLHGATFNAVMTGEFLRTAPRWTTIVATVVIGLLSTVAIALLSPPKAFATVVAVAGGYAAINGILLFDRMNLIVGAAGPLVAAGVVWSGVTLIQFIREIGERARLTKRFSSYVDPTLVNYVIENPEQARLEAHEKELTVVFTDLAGFTTLAEKLRAQSAKMLGQYMEAMVPLIRARRGYVNKFLGDGIMFFFGAPIDNPNHAADAVAAVLDMENALVPFNADLERQGLPTLAMRAGVTTGMMVVGDAGPSFASDYTVLGDAVNLAARMEGANKAFGTNNLITSRTVELLGGRYLVRPIADLLVVGKEQSVFVHEAMAPAETATDAQKRLAALTAEMVSCFAAGKFEDCLRAAAEIERAFGATKLTERYTEEAEGRRGLPADPNFRGQIQMVAK